MKTFILPLVVVALATALPSEVDLASQFKQYALDFNKTYAPEEIDTAMAAFQVNLEQINNDNALEGSEVYGLTKFSDILPAEFAKRYLTYKRDASFDRASVPVVETTNNGTTSIDWRTKGKVTPVKDQGNCGSCWAFSATEAIESAWLMAGKPQAILAPQQIVSCDKKDLGCNGGDTPTAYKYVQKAGGMVAESAYKYTSGNNGKTGKCAKGKLKKKVVQITGFKYATPPSPNMETGRWKPDEDKMAASMTQMGPLSVCVDAGKWQNYKKGIITKTCKQQLDHCVQAVGFDKSGSQPYWIVRNSWNTDWGIKGYINVGMGGNFCGIANEATSVTV